MKTKLYNRNSSDSNFPHTHTGKRNRGILCLSLFVCLFFSQVRFSFGQQAASIPHDFTVTPTLAAYPTTASTNLYASASMNSNIVTLASPAGFSFTFGGVTYTQVVVSNHGWIALVPGSVTHPLPSVFNNLHSNDLSHNTTGYPIIAPLWDNLSCNLISYNFYQGKLWVRWSIDWQAANMSAAAVLFTVSLDPATCTINFHYSNNSTYIPFNPSASIGIASAIPGDFYSVYATSSNTAYVDSTVENYNIGMATAPGTSRPDSCSYTFTCRASTTGTLEEKFQKEFLNVNPTISNSNLSAEFFVEMPGDFSLTIVDNTGRIVFEEKIEATAGINNYQRNINALASGMYYLQLTSNSQVKKLSARFLKP